jgi:hypothetical protein
MTKFTVLAVGATGSIGRHVVRESLRRGHQTRALVRDAGQEASMPAAVEIVVGDLTSAGTLAGAVDGADGIVFTHGSPGDATEAENVDYGAVRNVLEALGARPARIALMTAIGVTRHLRPRLEASGRASPAGQRPAVHHRAPRLVRLQRGRPAASSDAARRPPLGGRPLRRRRLTRPDRSGPRRQPHLRGRRPQVS